MILREVPALVILWNHGQIKIIGNKEIAKQTSFSESGTLVNIWILTPNFQEMFFRSKTKFWAWFHLGSLLEYGRFITNHWNNINSRVPYPTGMANNANFISISTSIIKKKFHENGININMLLMNSTILELISILPNLFSSWAITYQYYQIVFTISISINNITEPFQQYW